MLFYCLIDGSSDSEHEEVQDGGDEEISESNIIGVIDIVCILLKNNKVKMKTPTNQVYWDNIKKRYNKSCSLFFRYFRV